MNAEIISIGTELLLGHVVNTNASFLSEKLAEAGIDVYRHATVGDNPARLTAAIMRALGRSDIVITSGGLGPTVDDITIETVAQLIGRKLILNRIILKDVKDYFKSKKVLFPKESLRQAYIPEGVKWIRNRVGTAPGLIAQYFSKKIVCLPGPPREIVPMFERDILPIIKRMSGGPVIRFRTIKTTGLAESQVDGKVRDLLNLKPPTTVGIYAKLGQVDLKIMAKAKTVREAERNISTVEKKIRFRLKEYIFGYDTDTLESAVVDTLIKKGLTIATAESCTGGLLANRITNVGGSSESFKAGLIAYANEAKESFLGVSHKTLKLHGAVSRPVAIEMAHAIKHYACADIGISITGIAGPTGGTKNKPVGLIYIALVTNEKCIVKEMRFRGSREEIKLQSSQAALDLIRRICALS
ncbi:MAG: competence/damage-inducible protein A [Candidatus Omnitrophica bacterium]|nr:competence/damage-inducible protein A [Candidatus Omnitrophota bacterium]